MLSDAVKKQVVKQFERLKDQVELIVFTQEFECDFCRETRSLAEELGGLSEKINVQVLRYPGRLRILNPYGDPAACFPGSFGD